MKKYLLSGLVLFLCLPVILVSAQQKEIRGGGLLQEAGKNAGYKEAEQKISGQTSQKILESAFIKKIIDIIQLFLQFLGIVLLIIIIYAGFLWLTAGGNQEQVSKARKWITNGVIGMIIVSISWAIAIFIEESFFGELIPK